MSSRYLFRGSGSKIAFISFEFLTHKTLKNLRKSVNYLEVYYLKKWLTKKKKKRILAAYRFPSNLYS